MKEQIFIKSYEDNGYIGVKLDERVSITPISSIIPSGLGKLSKMKFDDQMDEILKFPPEQILLAESAKDMFLFMNKVRYTHVIQDGKVVSYNKFGDVI